MSRNYCAIEDWKEAERYLPEIMTLFAARIKNQIIDDKNTCLLFLQIEKDSILILQKSCQ